MSRPRTNRFKVFWNVTRSNREWMLYHLEAKVSLLVIMSYFLCIHSFKTICLCGGIISFGSISENSHVTKRRVSCLSPFCLLLGVVFTELTSICLFNIADLYYRCYGCSLYIQKMLITKSLVYSGTKALSKPSTGRGNSEGQETCSFEEAHVEFPSRWDLNATIVECEMRENCQILIKQIAKQNAK